MEWHRHGLEGEALRISAVPRAALPLAAAMLAGILIGSCGSAAAAPRLSPSPAPSRHDGGQNAFTVGVDLYAIENYPLAQARTYGQRDIVWIARSLGLRAVQIDFNLAADDQGVRPGLDTASTADIAELTDIAHSYGMRVSYRVLFNGGPLSIRPIETAAWFASLYAAELPYLELAQREHAAEFIAGGEHGAVEDSPGWGHFYAIASYVYHGVLSYASWGGRPGAGGVFGGDLSGLTPASLYGVTAYPSVSLPPSASQQRLDAAWEAFLGHAPASVLRRTAIDEIGIPAADGAYARPWDWGAFTGPLDDLIQARWFTAACTAARAQHMRGVWFFAVFLDDNPAHPYPGLAKFESRPISERAIRGCADAGI
jgi:glycosyl hydrolase family 113